MLKHFKKINLDYNIEVFARKLRLLDFQQFFNPDPKGSKLLKISTPFRVGVNADFQH